MKNSMVIASEPPVIPSAPSVIPSAPSVIPSEARDLDRANSGLPRETTSARLGRDPSLTLGMTMLLGMTVLLGCAQVSAAPAATSDPVFEWFEYAGNDSVYNTL